MPKPFVSIIIASTAWLAGDGYKVHRLPLMTLGLCGFGNIAQKLGHLRSLSMK